MPPRNVIFSRLKLTPSGKRLSLGIRRTTDCWIGHLMAGTLQNSLSKPQINLLLMAFGIPLAANYPVIIEEASKIDPQDANDQAPDALIVFHQ